MNTKSSGQHKSVLNFNVKAQKIMCALMIMSGWGYLLKKANNLGISSTSSTRCVYNGSIYRVSMSMSMSIVDLYSA